MRLQLGTGGHSGRGAAWRTSCMELLGQKENTEMRTSATTQTRHYEAVSRLYDILCLWKSEFKGRDYIAHAFPGGSPSYLVSNNKERDPMSHQIYCQFYLQRANYEVIETFNKIIESEFCSVSRADITTLGVTIQASFVLNKAKKFFFTSLMVFKNSPQPPRCLPICTFGALWLPPNCKVACPWVRKPRRKRHMDFEFRDEAARLVR